MTYHDGDVHIVAQKGVAAPVRNKRIQVRLRWRLELQREFARLRRQAVGSGYRNVCYTLGLHDDAVELRVTQQDIIVGFALL